MNMTQKPQALGVASIEECDAFLDANPHIQNVQIFFVNQSGVPRGKNLRRRDIRPVFEYARMIPGTMLALDITGADVEESGFVMSDGDADRLGRPVPGTFAPAPWLGDDFAQVMLSVYELDGGPCDVDPRHVLKRVIDRFKEFGLTPVIACELEFYVIDKQLPEGGGRQGPAGLTSGHRAKDIQVYGLRELDDFQPFLDDVYKFGEAAGLPLESAIAENAPAQLEIGLRHRADALRATDEAQIFKRVLKARPSATASKPPSWPSRITASPATASISMSAWSIATARTCSPATIPWAARCCAMRSVAWVRCWKNRWRSLRPTPTPISASRPTSMPRWRRPGASTTARWGSA